MSTALLVVLLVIAGVLGHRQLAGLRPVPRGGPEGGRGGEVSVVVPARDEATRLPALLTSLATLESAVAEVVVVDDGSSDGTAEVARARGARVLPVTAVPAGWTGKAHACHLGAQATTGRILLFLDADTVLAPDALGGLLALRQDRGGLVSVQPYHQVERPYEQLSAYFNVVSLMGSGAFSDRERRRPMAFGPCLLTTRADYERAGGHAAARANILDDAGLAAAYAQAGLPVRCFAGGDLVRMRMYPGGPRQLAEGWTKNIASGASQAATGPAVAAAVWVAAHFAVAVGALLSVAGAVAGSPVPLSSGSLVVWLLAWLGAALQLRWFLHRIGSFRWWTWAVFPVPLLAFGLLFARSLVLTYLRRSVRWRGRDVGLTRSPASTKDA
ncbi:glycosyltransferase [Luteipulveratus sp. YIM 133132]|uniref:glycosyltransferase n=1 Tax=Luteipulveratus flavus TaxID=3031728 RepID=UPI0023AFBE9A|nr:glycosyltransferase [Luteipulveratus sp. YIM 133132]MDE9365714.1 glycosyltransferase [Luteipulveratus sp. YIM 133132]